MLRAALVGDEEAGAAQAILVSTDARARARAVALALVALLLDISSRR